MSTTVHGTELQVGQRLFTRDGRRIGNAIVTNIEPDAELIFIYSIETDFGNTTRFTPKELFDAFYVRNHDGEASINDVAAWRSDKRELWRNREIDAECDAAAQAFSAEEAKSTGMSLSAHRELEDALQATLKESSAEEAKTAASS